MSLLNNAHRLDTGESQTVVARAPPRTQDLPPGQPMDLETFQGTYSDVAEIIVKHMGHTPELIAMLERLVEVCNVLITESEHTRLSIANRAKLIAYTRDGGGAPPPMQLLRTDTGEIKIPTMVSEVILKEGDLDDLLKSRVSVPALVDYLSSIEAAQRHGRADAFIAQWLAGIYRGARASMLGQILRRIRPAYTQDLRRQCFGAANLHMGGKVITEAIQTILNNQGDPDGKNALNLPPGASPFVLAPGTLAPRLGYETGHDLYTGGGLNVYTSGHIVSDNAKIGSAVTSDGSWGGNVLGFLRAPDLAQATSGLARANALIRPATHALMLFVPDGETHAVFDPVRKCYVPLKSSSGNTSGLFICPYVAHRVEDAIVSFSGSATVVMRDLPEPVRAIHYPKERTIRVTRKFAATTVVTAPGNMTMIEAIGVNHYDGGMEGPDIASPVGAGSDFSPDGAHLTEYVEKVKAIVASVLSGAHLESGWIHLSKETMSLVKAKEGGEGIVNVTAPRVALASKIDLRFFPAQPPADSGIAFLAEKTREAIVSVVSDHFRDKARTWADWPTIQASHEAGRVPVALEVPDHKVLPRANSHTSLKMTDVRHGVSPLKGDSRLFPIAPLDYAR